MEDRLLAPVPAREEAPFRGPCARKLCGLAGGAREGPGLRQGNGERLTLARAVEAAALPRPRPGPAPSPASLPSTLPAPHPCVVFGFPANPRWP